MKIQWSIDTQERIDPLDLLGEFKMIDASSRVVEDKCIYLDSIFYALSEGLLHIFSVNLFSSDLVDEPKPLNFVRNNDNLRISYGNQYINTFFREAILETCRSYNELVTLIKPHSGVGAFNEINQNIKKIQQLSFR